MNSSAITQIKPKTLEGIKSLAKKLKKAHEIQHCQALDLAALRAGYENFRHAQKSLRSSGQREPGSSENGAFRALHEARR